MGICSSTSATHVATAKLILQDGRLQEFAYPVKVSYVLQKNPSCFICNSDEMDFDDARRGGAPARAALLRPPALQASAPPPGGGDGRIGREGELCAHEKWRWRGREMRVSPEFGLADCVRRRGL
ncbi:hypothetical protein L484_011736 [Morus notabilis]|uniref:Uncharacterized protein n=1 Tax=Morus notabilis TaxID=981085 RepID=W9RUN9_9ROSA|nr:hypothetical protein L484_011736 [Morus notabilis]